MSLPPGCEPIQLLEVELSQPLPEVRLGRLGGLAGRETGRRYERAQCLVRLHTYPLGFVDVRCRDGVVSPEGYARSIWQALGRPILEHLRRDGLPEVAGLGPDGLPHQGEPPCVAARRGRLRDAPFASVVVATRDRPESIAACLASMAALDYPQFEVIVVDNVPTTDATRAVVERVGNRPDSVGPVVRYAREDRPGPSWARNRGLRLARGDVVAFADDDVLVDPHWLAELVAGFAAGPDVACVTGPIVPRELETPAQIWLEQYGGYCKGFDRCIYDLAAHRPPDPLFPYTMGRFGSGQNMAFRTATLRDLGGLDPALGPATPTLAGEDIALFLEVILAGHQLVYEPGAIVYHAHLREYAWLRQRVYNYGLGLAACVTKSVLDHPKTLPALLRRLPGGVAYALSPRSPKNQKKLAGYPRELTWRELRGLLNGPLAYLRSRRRYHGSLGVTASPAADRCMGC